MNRSIFVEVIGIPGSGKSTFCGKILKNDILNTNLIMSNIEELSISQLKKYALNNSRNYLESTLIKNCSLPFLKRYLKFIDSQNKKNFMKDENWKKFYYFIKKNLTFEHQYIIEKENTFFQYMSNKFKVLNSYQSNTNIEDGGFLFRSSYFLNYNKPSEFKQWINLYLKMIPILPDFVIWIDIDPELALSKINTRPNSVVPYFLRDCKSNSQKLKKLETLNKNLRDVVFKLFPNKYQLDIINNRSFSLLSGDKDFNKIVVKLKKLMKAS